MGELITLLMLVTNILLIFSYSHCRVFYVNFVSVGGGHFSPSSLPPSRPSSLLFCEATEDSSSAVVFIRVEAELKKPVSDRHFPAELYFSQPGEWIHSRWIVSRLWPNISRYGANKTILDTGDTGVWQALFYFLFYGFISDTWLFLFSSGNGKFVLWPSSTKIIS